MQTELSPKIAHKSSLGFVSLLVVMLGVAAALIHLSLVSAEFNKGATVYGTLFVLATVGYLALLAAMYLPMHLLDPVRTPARIMLIVTAVGSIVTYVLLGYYDTLGWVTKVIEAALVIAAVAELNTQRRGA